MKRLDAATLTTLHAHNPNPYDEATNAGLLDSVPVGLRLLHYTRTSVPAAYLSSFGFYHDKIGNIHLDQLPPTMQREVMFALWRIVELGGRVPCAPLGLLTRELASTCERLARTGQPHRSLLERTPQQWREELSHTWVQRTRELPNANTLRTVLAPLDRMIKLLWFAYETTPWWTREVWDPVLDQRIPRREHEPLGNRAIHWHRLDPAWLRTAAMWWVKTELEGNQITLTTASGKLEALLPFGAFATARHLLPAQLVEDHQLLRPLMLDFLHDIIATPSQRPGSRNGLLSTSRVTQIASVVRGFYAFMHDHRDDACAALHERHWAQLSAEHLRFWRMGDLPRSRVTAFDERHLVSDEALSALTAALPLMGRPTAEGGVGDPQAMRILHLLIATGRRISEICLMSTDPLTPVPVDNTPEAGAADGADNADAGAGSGAIAKLRYTQTKIEGAPDTIFVGADVISVIEEQQRWLREHAAAAGHPAPVNGYLFVKYQNNRRGDRPYTASLLRTQLRKLIERADLRDGTGVLLDLSSTHRFRHTKATSLINAGVPLHVVQRYLGHSSPEMTMHYAQTLDTTAKAEFLRYQKLTATGQPATVPA